MVIVGIGNLGHALANYSGFRSRGFRVVALLDADPERHDEVVAGVDVRPFDDLAQIVREQGVAIGVIATPAAAAQDVADQMVAVGITSILNFAPTVLTVGPGVDVRKVDLSIELQILAYHEQRKAQEARHEHPRTPRARCGPADALVVGISHRSAPISLLERLAVDTDGAAKLIEDVLANPHVSEATVVATCNRLEIYAAVDRFHGSVEELSQRLLAPVDESVETLLPHLYIHYDDGAVSHLFRVAAGLDSMAVGEAQILGQTRDALQLGAGARLGRPGAQLRSSSRRSASASAPTPRPASTGSPRPSSPRPSTAPSTTCSGAGSSWSAPARWPALAVATVVRRGARPRSSSSTAPPSGPSASPVSTPRAGRRCPPCAGEIADRRRRGRVRRCRRRAGHPRGRRRRGGRPLAAGRPRAAARHRPVASPTCPGVTLVTLADLAAELHDTEAGAEVEAVRTIVTDEVEAFLAARRQSGMTPTVVALRTMATGVVDSEMARLDRRLPDLDDATRAEVLQTAAPGHRQARAPAHDPRQGARQPQRASPTPTALAELFALDPDAVEAVDPLRRTSGGADLGR